MTYGTYIIYIMYAVVKSKLYFRFYFIPFFLYLYPYMFLLQTLTNIKSRDTYLGKQK